MDKDSKPRTINEVTTTLKRMGVYYLLLAVNVLFCANVIADRFPSRNLSTVYLLVLAVCLVLYYHHRVTPIGGIAPLMKSLSLMGLTLILLRGIKYSVVAEVGVLARHAWYLYYVPMLLLPLCLFYIALLVSAKDNARIPKVWYWVPALTFVLILSVLTNDLHQQMFRFQADYVNWDWDYTRGWLFYLVTVWQFVLFAAAFIILVIKCRIMSSKRNAWIILIPVATGLVLYALLYADLLPKINGAPIVEVPETHIFLAALVLECCMQLGLVPTNTEYGKVFRNLPISAQITDQAGTAVYASTSAVPLTPAQFALPSGTRIDEHTVLNKMTLAGGFGFWQDDMTELDRLNEELAEAKEGLAQEAELIRLRNELQEKQTRIRQRTLVYDTIAKCTQKQSQLISRLAKEARESADPALKDAYRHRITLLGAYIKRYANLMLLSRESSVIEVGELAISVSEVLRYLNYCGIPGEFIGGADCTVSSEAALAVFEAFESLLEANFHALCGVFVNVSSGAAVSFKIILEHLSVPLAEDVTARLASAAVHCDTQCEDDVTYVCLTMPKGGAAS